MTTSTLPSDYRDRVYAGWLGKCIGVRLGVPVEGWSYAEIAAHLGEIGGLLPLPDGKVFMPDDDTAFPMVLIRALEEYGPELTPAQIGDTVLNYLGDQRGTLWWGGYGVSTEHTAYLNLRHGIAAPRSGSITQNGRQLAEQIGGQIFSDIWGLIAPNNPQRAAEYAARASSVTHDGAGIDGARFVAGLVSQAFVTADPVALVETGLSLIPPDGDYAGVVRSVLQFFREGADDWRACYRHIADHWGYERFGGMVPIVPNAGVVVMALLYSGGNFGEAIRIATMAGWDTDCNAGNVGAIMGVAVGLAGIDKAWRAPLNDQLVVASLIGCRNLLDIPACADLFACLGQQLAGVAPSPALPRYHFDYPGATHNFQAEGHRGTVIDLRQRANVGEDRHGALQATVRGLNKKGECYVFVPTYYRPAELSGNNYGASFSPLIYPGQTITADLFLPADASDQLLAALSAWDDNHQTSHQAPGTPLTPGQWHTLTYTVPPLANALLARVGVVLRNLGQPWSGHFLLDGLDWRGPVDWSTDFRSERPEYGALSQWTFLRGYWRLEDGAYHGSSAQDGESYTGDINWRDLWLSVDMAPLAGDYHNINMRVQGARRSYAVGLAPGQRLVMYKNTGGYRPIATAPLAWEHGRRYRVEVNVDGPAIAVAVDEQPLLHWVDPEAPYLHGQIGLSTFSGSHTRYERVAVRGKA